jgi:hypothetical protein
VNLEKISSARLTVLSTAASAFMPSLINSAQAAPRNSRPLASHGVGRLAWVGSGVLQAMHLADVRPLGCGDAGAGRLSREAENTEPHCTGEYEEVVMCKLLAIVSLLAVPGLVAVPGLMAVSAGSVVCALCLSRRCRSYFPAQNSRNRPGELARTT